MKIRTYLYIIAGVIIYTIIILQVKGCDKQQPLDSKDSVIVLIDTVFLPGDTTYLPETKSKLKEPDKIKELPDYTEYTTVFDTTMTDSSGLEVNSKTEVRTLTDIPVGQMLTQISQTLDVIKPPETRVVILKDTVEIQMVEQCERPVFYEDPILWIGTALGLLLALFTGEVL